VTVKKKWMPITAGVLDLIVGVYLLNFVIVYIMYPGLMLYIGVSLFLFTIVAPDILAIVAGIYALKRKKWRLVLATTIVALILPLPLFLMLPITSYLMGPTYFSGDLLIGLINVPLAIAAVVLIALSKGEFERKAGGGS
jgi:hypothetical protein